MEEVIYTPGDRFRLHTTSSGIVHLQIGEIHCSNCVTRKSCSSSEALLAYHIDTSIGLIMKEFERNHVHMG